MVSPHFPMFGGDRSSAKGYIKCLICHVTSQNNLIGWELFIIYQHLTKFDEHSCCNSKYKMFLVCHGINTLRANPTKWSNTLKKFVGNSRRIF